MSAWVGKASGGLGDVGRCWELRPPDPGFGLNGLVLKRRTGWMMPAWVGKASGGLGDVGRC
ncbi:hypothetical protein SAMN05216489_03006 [Streptomyces sp. 3213]|nr:hypothetical protein SAMN05216489_03006 [Streptomyces sp. 3213] [Streptomyces sp. 3213.3]